MSKISINLKKISLVCPAENLPQDGQRLISYIESCKSSKNKIVLELSSDDEGNTQRIAHFESLKKDTRDEIKKRIEQRDKYSIQLTVALTAIFAISFGSKDYDKALIAAPLVSIYFTLLILYSYRIHSVCAEYLGEVIEPTLVAWYETPLESEWENYYVKKNVPGIRKKFFMSALWTINFLSLGYLLITHCDDSLLLALGIYALVCFAASFIISWAFWNK